MTIIDGLSAPESVSALLRRLRSRERQIATARASVARLHVEVLVLRQALDAQSQAAARFRATIHDQHQRLLTYRRTPVVPTVAPARAASVRDPVDALPAFQVLGVGMRRLEVE